MSNAESHTGVFDRYRWRSASGAAPYIIAHLEDGTTVQGPAGDGDLVPGISYEFYASGSGRGWQEHPAHGRSFKFSMYVVKIPHARHGIIAYLQKYGVGIGPVVATRIWDKFGPDSVKILRTNPKEVVAAKEIGRYFPLEKAEESAKELAYIADLEDTKIGLTNLFAGRGFPTALVEQCVSKWRILAPLRITRDPFTLLVNDMAGCGFARCDRLYIDLGLAPDRLKRQMICIWHSLHADSSGNTWVTADTAVQRLRQLVSGARLNPKKAIRLGLRSGWLAKRRDEAGVLWLAEGQRAEDEAFVAQQVKLLGTWQMANNAEVMTLVHAAECTTVEQMSCV